MQSIFELTANSKQLTVKTLSTVYCLLSTATPLGDACAA